MDQAAKGLMICQWQFILPTGKFKSGLLFQYHDYGTRAKHDHGRSRSRSIWFIIFTWLKMSCLLGEGSFALDVDPFKTIPLQVRIQGGASWARAPPDPRFWGPKIEHFWALFNFSIIFFASLRSAYYFFNMLLIHSSNWKIFQPRFARHVISHLEILVSHILGY